MAQFDLASGSWCNELKRSSTRVSVTALAFNDRANFHHFQEFFSFNIAFRSSCSYSWTNIGAIVMHWKVGHVGAPPRTPSFFSSLSSRRSSYIDGLAPDRIYSVLSSDPFRSVLRSHPSERSEGSSSGNEINENCRYCQTLMNHDRDPEATYLQLCDSCVQLLRS